MNNQFTLVLPIKIKSHEHNELSRFIHIQLASLNKFLDPNSVYEFIIICKENEIKTIQKALLEKNQSLPINVISEDTLIDKKISRNMPQIVSKNVLIDKEIAENIGGWYLQQLIKLSVAKIIKTPLYLILDTDCFLTKPLSYADLFYHGKILMDKEPWTTHPDWWLNSINIVNEVPLIKLASQLAIGVTPQILIKSVVCELLHYLDHKEPGLDWRSYLAGKQFTEFSLYWLFLLKTNRTDLYQSSAGPSLLGNALWRTPWKWRTRLSLLRRLRYRLFDRKRLKSREIKINLLKQVVEQQVKTSFESNDYFHFSLIQSNIEEIPVNWIIEQTSKYLI